jgi:predicted GTPase
VGTIAGTFQQYPEIGTLLPAMGYGDQQVKDMEATVNATECDLVLIATPIDLRRIMKVGKPALRVGYELQEIGTPTLADALARF